MSRIVRGLVGAAALFASASVVNAGMVEVELIPDNPGPYYGGESLTVDVWLHSQYEYDVGLRSVQFDFTNTDSALTLAPTFEFDYSSVPDDLNGYLESLELPVPWTYMWLDCYCPTLLMHLDAQGSIPVGVLDVVLPMAPGVFTMDAMHADAAHPEDGAQVRIGFTIGETGLWRATDGEVVGGQRDFLIIPEPGTLTLVALALLAGNWGPRVGARRAQLA
jgi:hypothetical protein